ncbi:hypothetical protein BO78DRAFT_27215 [Aspergillus sclerotiicarbonarius CBS 121057]|uniref:Uncharacterized protein n=1 Tax=Aspergillus sclerotiicarbonarius (strain CBS 121057 / IBT 28362) TaxID=1448318 RepID=A0A319DTN4_ASPSB|nr:hypothetical protein BO78DRAFT_27215 [Aspergillus sclerotiicarbonarius CBS 121057]
MHAASPAFLPSFTIPSGLLFAPVLCAFSPLFCRAIAAVFDRDSYRRSPIFPFEPRWVPKGSTSSSLLSQPVNPASNPDLSLSSPPHSPHKLNAAKAVPIPGQLLSDHSSPRRLIIAYRTIMAFSFGGRSNRPRPASNQQP